jgi:hypothetical protein
MPLALEIPVADETAMPPPADVAAVGAERRSRRPKSWPFRTVRFVAYIFEWLFGLASLLGCLAVLAAVPVLNLVSFGYLLEASGAVARSGRLRDGFLSIYEFARIGSIVAGTWLCLLVPRFVASLASDALLIDPQSLQSRGWRVAQIVVTLLAITHVLLAWYSGGRLRHFLWPVLVPFQIAGRLLLRVTRPLLRPIIAHFWPNLADDLYAVRPWSDWFPPATVLAGMRRGILIAEARDAVWDFTMSLRPLHYFWLGLRGFLGALTWLLVPSLMLMVGTSGRGPASIVVGYLGALAMMGVAALLPFLETNFARTNRLSAFVQINYVRMQLRRAPLLCWLALTITLLFALPLYLLKIEPPPRELWWTLTIFFVLFIYPARLLTGWAVGLAEQRQQSRPVLLRLVALAAALPVLAFYVFIVFFTQYTSFLGPASILEQHAFLLPVPFLGL